jgi:hypothetical protein
MLSIFSRGLRACSTLVLRLERDCASLGSGWAREGAPAREIERHRGGTEILELVDALTEDLAAGMRVGSGSSARSSSGRGESAPTWCYPARGRRAGLFLWHAFATDKAKATTHVDDATMAVAGFTAALPDAAGASAVTAERPPSVARLSRRSRDVGHRPGRPASAGFLARTDAERAVHPAFRGAGKSLCSRQRDVPGRTRTSDLWFSDRCSNPAAPTQVPRARDRVA